MNPAADSLEPLLRQIAQAAPAPWYPKLYAEQTGVTRDSLDQPLEKLRLGGLISLTPWEQGRGQGYRLTPAGELALRNPHELTRLRDLKPEAFRDERPRAESQGRTTFEQGEEAREALLSSSSPVITQALIFANVAVFACGMFLASRDGLPLNEYLYGSGEQKYLQILHDTGAVDPTSLLAGQWWRLLTCCFVHIGLAHLGVNMFSLYMLGPLTEKMWRRGRFLAIYLIAGLVGSCTAMIVKPVTGEVDGNFQPVLLAGASGAIWGIMGALITWVFLHRRFLPPSGYHAWMRQLLLVVLLNVFVSTMPRISASAHFGGGAAGVIAAVFLNWQRFGPPLLRISALAAVAALPLLSIGALVHVRQTSPVWQKLDARFQRRQEVRRLQEEARQAQAQGAKAETDWNDLRGRLLSPAEDARKVALQATQRAAALLEQEPGKRPRADVMAALEELNGARRQLDEAIWPLAQTKPYPSPEVEEARKMILEHLEARSDLCAMAEQYLREARPLTGKDAEVYQRQVERVIQLQDRRKKALP